MMQSKRIEILMAAYNGAPYIRGQAGSIWARETRMWKTLLRFPMNKVSHAARICSFLSVVTIDDLKYTLMGLLLHG